MTDQRPDRRKRKHPYRQHIICTECKRKVDCDYTAPKDNSMAGKTFSFNTFLMKLRQFRIELNLQTFNCAIFPMVAVSLDGKMVNVCVFIAISTPTLSGISQFFRARKSPPPQVRRCQYAYAENYCLTNPINKTFMRLIHLINSTFLGRKKFLTH